MAFLEAQSLFSPKSLCAETEEDSESECAYVEARKMELTKLGRRANS